MTRLRPTQVGRLVLDHGARWTCRRALYELERRWVLPRRLPITTYTTFRPPHPSQNAAGLRTLAGTFFFGAPEEIGDALSRTLGAEAKTVRDQITTLTSGRMPLFGGEPREIGWPPSWREPEGPDSPALRHWTSISDFGDIDIKEAWEPARFGAAYLVVRAHALWPEDGYDSAFWQLVESFREASPPNGGIHWMCGQECAYRVLAWCFGLFAFLDSPLTDEARIASLLEMLIAHGHRIEGNIGYALLQENNHTVNEALALWTLGTLFPWLREASRWEARGREVLECEARRQISDDGGYVQHSLGYHRLVLESYVWALRLAELAGQPFSARLIDRVRRAAHLLFQLTDDSGRAPNYGSNDGSRLFRLDSCALGDYRPTLAVAFWAVDRRRVFPPGLWDETLVWLYGEEPLGAPAEPLSRHDVRAVESGYFTLHGTSTWAFTRCGPHRKRPAQADMLHVDIWWRGHNLVSDPGTFSYNHPTPWNNSLAKTAVHNAMTIDHVDQMERGPRFLWLDWVQGRSLRHESIAGGQVKVFEGRHDGFERRLGVIHHRTVVWLDDHAWVVTDDIRGTGEHALGLTWLFAGAIRWKVGAAGCVEVETPAGTCRFGTGGFEAGGSIPLMIDTVFGGAGPLGWFSPTYLQRKPALNVIATASSPLPARLISVFLLTPEAELTLEGSTTTEVSTGAEIFRLDWNPLHGESPGLAAATLTACR
ncbi:MAG TPA: alginate lyase family protein [Thermoanaerobaculia bacterium]|nr:alginate lyase family protein [Thermoanaerobaculia bacterium]